jgi:transporter
VGVLIGAAIMGVLKNGFVLLKFSTYWQMITLGAVIIVAVVLDGIRNRKI